jgi:hypothetical protein
MLHCVQEARHARPDRNAESERSSDRKGRPFHVQASLALCRLSMAVQTFAFSFTARDDTWPMPMPTSW